MKIHVFHKLLLNLLILIALALLVIGIFSPLMTLQKFYFFENQISLFSALQDLLIKQWSLFVIILIFSIVLPMIKIVFLLLVLNSPAYRQAAHKRFMQWLANIGKWSMLDVFVVALLLVSVKLDVIANVQIHYGIYAFGGSVLLTMIITQWINWISARTV